jgi:uncharacterized protein (TIGR03067 family)
MPNDLERLQGTWSVSSLEVEGQKMSENMLAEANIVIKGKRFTSNGMGAVYKGTLRLDESTDPAQLDMKFDAGPEKGTTNFGIYKLDGDKWKLCLATRGTVRPKRFASGPGSGFALETLIRGERKPAPKPKAAAQKASSVSKTPSTPATEFEGEWQMVSGVMNGDAMKKSDVQWVKRVTVGNVTSIIAGPQTLVKFEFTSDSSKSPAAIDYVNTAGSNKGKTQFGIYAFEGDELRVCMAAPGSARPARFESLRGDGATYTVWKRLG